MVRAPAETRPSIICTAHRPLLTKRRTSSYSYLTYSTPLEVECGEGTRRESVPEASFYYDLYHASATFAETEDELVLIIEFLDCS